MKVRFLSLVSVLLIVLLLVPVSVAAGPQSAEQEFAWVLIEINDYENADQWAASDAHESYIVTHGYSQGAYGASTTYEGDDPYKQGLSGTLAVRAVFSGMPDIIYPDKPVSLRFGFAPTENSVVNLSFTASASADFDQWDVEPGGKTGRAVEFVNNEGESAFVITSQNSESYDEVLTASLGAGSENSRIALRLRFAMGVSMGTNYVYEWKQVGGAPTEPKQPTPPAPSPSPSPSPMPEVRVIRFEVPPPDDPEWETYSTEIVKFGDLYGEVNVKRYGEDDDAYTYAELDTPLHHGMVIRTHSRSGAILSFSDMSTFVVKENTIIVLDIKEEKESKIALVAGNIWINLKKMVTDGSMEVEMSQAVAGIKGTILAASVTETGEEVYLFTSSAQVTSKKNGQTVTLEPGEKASIGQEGDIQVSQFDIADQAEAFDIAMSDLEAGGYGVARGSSLIWIILAVVGGITAIIIVMLLRKNKVRAQ